MVAEIPHDRALDSSLAFKIEGYDFVANRCRRFGSDIFRARLLGRSFHCVRGADAAAMFYEPDRFTRNGAMPKPTLKLLQDEGSVATLDAAEHRHRKAMLMSLMTPAAIDAVAARAASALRDRFAEPRAQAILHDELKHALCRAACDWAGVPLDHERETELTRELGAMIANAGTIGPSNWRARRLRHRTERWLAGIVEATRSGDLRPPEDRALHVITHHRDPDGELLPTDIAVVEVLNILRPIVAVARFMTFAALALHENPQLRERLTEDEAFLEAFVQEVRRHYPFFPVIAGVARTDFAWRGWDFSEGDRFMLDLYGTCHDERLWEEPGAFRPERFLGREASAFDLIPQGGGDHFLNHRCAGEWTTIAIMKAMTRCLLRDLTYAVPAQDLDVPLNRFPSLPKSGFVVADARAMTEPERLRA